MVWAKDRNWESGLQGGVIQIKRQSTEESPISVEN